MSDEKKFIRDDVVVEIKNLSVNNTCFSKSDYGSRHV